MPAVVLTWDWMAQPPMEEIARRVNAAMFTGGTFMYPVRDTGGDCYAVVLSPVELDAREVQAAYDAERA